MSKGLNYAPKPKNIPLVEVIAEIETGIQFLPDGNKMSIRKEIAPILRHATQANNIETTISPEIS